MQLHKKVLLLSISLIVASSTLSPEVGNGDLFMSECDTNSGSVSNLVNINELNDRKDDSNRSDSINANKLTEYFDHGVNVFNWVIVHDSMYHHEKILGHKLVSLIDNFRTIQNDVTRNFVDAQSLLSIDVSSDAFYKFFNDLLDTQIALLIFIGDIRFGTDGKPFLLLSDGHLISGESFNSILEYGIDTPNWIILITKNRCHVDLHEFIAGFYFGGDYFLTDTTSVFRFYPKCNVSDQEFFDNIANMFASFFDAQKTIFGYNEFYQHIELFSSVSVINFSCATRSGYDIGLRFIRK